MSPGFSRRPWETGSGHFLVIAVRGSSAPVPQNLDTTFLIGTLLLTLMEKALGLEDPNVAQSLENYAALLCETIRGNEAVEISV